MYQVNEKLVETHHETLKSIQALGQRALENSQSLAQAHYEETKKLLAKAIANGVGNLKDPQIMMQLFNAQSLHEASADIASYQAKVSSILRKNHQEIIEMADSAFNNAKKHLHELVNEAVDKAPNSTELLTSSCKAIFETTMQGYDQVRTSVHDAYEKLGKTVDSAINSHHQDSQQKIKKHKAVTAA
jgi:predicted NBD/HSP70 family sugar kinase